MNTDHSILAVRRMPASAQQSYLAWIDPELLGRWIGVPGEAAKIVVDPRVGGVFRVEGDAKASASGFFMELNPGRRIVLGWNESSEIAANVGGQSLVSIDLRSVLPDVTQLTLTHERLTSDAQRARYQEFWTERLDQLERFLATQS